MKRYGIRKVVRAMRVAEVDVDHEGGTLTLVSCDGERVKVSAEYTDQHNPAAGGYYLRAPDGAESWCPGHAFELLCIEV